MVRVRLRGQEGGSAGLTEPGLAPFEEGGGVEVSNSLG